MNDTTIKYDINRPWLSLDDWQKKYIDTTDSNCFLLCGRQVGKTAATSIKFGKLACTQKNRIILMIAITEKQAYHLFFKTLMYCEQVYPKMICKGLKKPTQHVINFTNGSKILCYAAGDTAEGLRGLTLTNLVCDEAAGLSTQLFEALTPALSVTRGHMDLLSTPRGAEGYFYECSKRDDFVKFYVNAEDCPRHDKNFLENQKKTMSKMAYAQEYLAVFLTSLKRLYSDEIITRACTLKRPDRLYPSKYFCGIDCARLGEDLTSFEIIEKINSDMMQQVENITTSHQLTTQTYDKIMELDRKYNFKKIGIDSAGTGSGVFDMVLRDPKTREKAMSMENARKAILNKDDKKGFVRLLKEDMYMLLLSLMEKKKIKLLDDDELIADLKSVQYEYVISENKKTYFRIFSTTGGHIVEGLIRAVFLANDDTSLDLWCR